MNPSTLIRDVDYSIIDVERALLGGCLSDTRGCAVWPTLMPAEFVLDAHRTVWQTMADMTEYTATPDLMGIERALRQSGELDAIGGPSFLAALCEAGAWIVDLAYCGRMVREAATTRAKLALGMALAGNPDMSQAEIEACLRSLETGEAIRAGSVSETLTIEYERLRTEPNIQTGLPALDAKLGGLARGQVIVIGGRTSHGKTAFATSIARTMAQQGVRVAYVSLEERAEAIHARWLAQDTGVSLGAIRQGRCDPDERDRLRLAGERLDALDLQVLTVGTPYEDTVIAALRGSDAEVVILDHLQQVITRDEKRNYALERVMARLNAVAMMDRKLLFITAQINRGADARKEAPGLADLRDSGAIEQVPRIVWLLYWPSRHDAKRSPTDYELDVAKNSEGSTGPVDLFYDARTGRFSGGG